MDKAIVEAFRAHLDKEIGHPPSPGEWAHYAPMREIERALDLFSFEEPRHRPTMEEIFAQLFEKAALEWYDKKKTDEVYAYLNYVSEEDMKEALKAIGAAAAIRTSRHGRPAGA